MIEFTLLHPRMTQAHLGLIPEFLSEDDPRPTREQFDENYVGGWQPFKGFKLLEGDKIQYPGDAPLIPLAFARLREEKIVFYQHSWIMILQPDKTYEICRMD